MFVSWTRELAGGHGGGRRGWGPGGGGWGTRWPGASAASARQAQVRVNQVGYTRQASKVAEAMLPATAGQVSYIVSGGRGHVAFHGEASQNAGSWNAAYPARRTA